MDSKTFGSLKNLPTNVKHTPKDDEGKMVLDAKGEPKRWADDGDKVFWPVLRQ